MERHSPRLTLLGEPVIKEIIDEAMGLLEKTGVTVEEPETLELLAEMGADIDSGKHTARFKRDMVERAVASAPTELELYSFSGERRFAFGDGRIHFNPGSAALFILDLEGPVMRKPLVEDVVRFSKLTHTLENIEAASTGVIPSDVPEEVSDSLRLFISCLFSFYIQYIQDVFFHIHCNSPGSESDIVGDHGKDDRVLCRNFQLNYVRHGFVGY